MDKFVQIFRRAVRESEYERRVLVEKFKRRMNDNIKHKLIKTEQLFLVIEE